MGITNLFDRNLGYDLTLDLPVIPKAVAATPQYLFPNRMMCGFGEVGIVIKYNTTVTGTLRPNTGI